MSRLRSPKIADGHAAKLLAPAATSRRLLKAARRFGIVSLGRVLDALDLEIVVRVRDEAPPRADLQIRGTAITLRRRR